jgi:hypothetical protein
VGLSGRKQQKKITIEEKRGFRQSKLILVSFFQRDFATKSQFMRKWIGEEKDYIISSGKDQSDSGSNN